MLVSGMPIQAQAGAMPGRIGFPMVTAMPQATMAPAGGVGPGNNNNNNGVSELTIAVLVPGEAIAKVIGKSGAGLRQVRETSGCRVNVEQAGETRDAARRVELVGMPQNVGVGAGLVLTAAFSGSMQATVEITVMVPDRCTGGVIGKGGENLKRVRGLTGARIQVEREAVTNTATNEQERILKVIGEPMAIGNGLCLALGGVMMGAGGQPRVDGGSAPVVPGTAAVAAAMAPKQEVQPMGDNPENVQIHIVIPGKVTGAIVGKQGAAIKSLSEQAGCRLSVSTRTVQGMRPPDRRVMAVGTFSQVCAAEQLVHNAVTQAEAGSEDATNSFTTIFWIPKEYSGAIIGKSGATLGQIRESTQVKVHFGKEEVRMMRPCTIVGPIANVIQAQSMVWNLLSVEMQNHGPAKRPPGSEPQPELESSKLLVPARSAGSVIGKAGSGLCKIREDHGVKIDMLQQAQAPHWTEDRVVILQGAAQNRQAAMCAVLQAAYQGDENNVNLKMLVSGQGAGALIGIKGGTLKQIREQTGLSTQVEKEPIMGERLVTCTGPMRGVLTVVGLIMNILSQPNKSGNNDGA